tara:strand:+ start:682 stop:891 length:210 start_codon:yes stop_codon:yes gene_type:complete
MATNADKLSALTDAIDTGAKTITLDGQTVTYRSLAEMRDVQRSLEESVNSGALKRRPTMFDVSNSLRGR